MENREHPIIENLKQQFLYYKQLGDQTFHQLEEKDLFWKFNSEFNSIAIIVNHIAGNMLSRWTDFLTTDGEKDWRNRDQEFEDVLKSKVEVMAYWEKGWECFLNALNQLNEDKDLNQIIYIRNQGHTVLEALQCQLAHYPYHIGQMVMIGKMIKNEEWKSLSIPKNESSSYNQEKFSKEKSKIHFTEEYINKKDHLE